MSHALIIGGLAVAIATLSAAILATPQLVRQRTGRLLLLVVAALTPLAISGSGAVAGMKRSSETEFCVSCHEMERYGKSLFVDDRRSLPAVHYQRRLIPREQTCFACHTDYAIFGDLKAKANGLRHVWVHYTRQVPDDIELYRPYPNYNCLHCHDDARGYLEVGIHQEHAASLRSGERSCLSCHNVSHDLDGVSASHFWQAEEAR